MSDNPLANKMLQRAEQDKLAKDHPLRIHGKALSLLDINTTSPTKLLGHWARARKAWSAYTGEPLLKVH